MYSQPIGIRVRRRHGLAKETHKSACLERLPHKLDLEVVELKTPDSPVMLKPADDDARRDADPPRKRSNICDRAQLAQRRHLSRRNQIISRETIRLHLSFATVLIRFVDGNGLLGVMKDMPGFMEE